MTVQQWCDFNHVSLYQYYYWRKRLAAAKNTNPANTTDKTRNKTDKADNGRWMRVAVADTLPLPKTSGAVTLRIAGAAIDVPPGFDPHLLRAIVSALASEPC